MTELTNAQVALQCAAEAYNGHTSTTILEVASRFKVWLDKQDEQDYKATLTKND